MCTIILYEGPTKFPLVGTLIQISLADSTPYVAFQKLAKEYGDVMSIKLGLKDASMYLLVYLSL